MTIQFNTDKNVTASEEFRASSTSLILKELGRFNDRITRLEVHLSDENGRKEGLNDKRCLLEARFGGMPPIAVTGEASTYEHAVRGAAEKLKTSLNTIVGRLKNH